MNTNNFLLAINVRWWNAEAAYAVNVARGLMAAGSSVWVIVNQNSPVHHKALEYDIPVITDIHLDSKSPHRQWQNYRKISEIIDKNEISVINSFKSNGSIVFNLLRMRKPELVYIRTRGEARPPKYHFLNDFFYGKRTCDGIIAVGNLVKQWIRQLNIDDQNIQTIYYGDSAPMSSLENDSASPAKRLQIPEDRLVMALLGRTQHVKGHLSLLKAITRFPTIDFQILFLVKDLEEYPDELRTIEQFIEDHHLKTHVTILGFQENLPEVLTCVDIGLIPSLSSEVNCRVAVEFYSQGIPIIAFPTGSLPEVVQHQKTGYLCAEKNEESLAKGLQWVLENQELLPTLSHNARNLYLENYTLEILAEKTLEFYQSCASQKN